MQNKPVSRCRAANASSHRSPSDRTAGAHSSVWAGETHSGRSGRASTGSAQLRRSCVRCSGTWRPSAFVVNTRTSSPWRTRCGSGASASSTGLSNHARSACAPPVVPAAESVPDDAVSSVAGSEFLPRNPSRAKMATATRTPRPPPTSRALRTACLLLTRLADCPLRTAGSYFSTGFLDTGAGCAIEPSCGGSTGTVLQPPQPPIGPRSYDPPVSELFDQSSTAAATMSSQRRVSL